MLLAQCFHIGWWVCSKYLMNEWVTILFLVLRTIKADDDETTYHFCRMRAGGVQSSWRFFISSGREEVLLTSVELLKHLAECWKLGWLRTGQSMHIRKVCLTSKVSSSVWGGHLHPHEGEGTKHPWSFFTPPPHHHSVLKFLTLSLSTNHPPSGQISTLILPLNCRMI